MGNTLINSMVRGFGFTLGKKAANSLTSTKRVESTQQVNLSKKQLELIQEYEDIKNNIENVLRETELYYTNGKITEGEYNILKARGNDQLVEANIKIEELKSVNTSSISIWPILIGLAVGIYGMLWLVKMLNL